MSHPRTGEWRLASWSLLLGLLALSSARAEEAQDAAAAVDAVVEERLAGAGLAVAPLCDDAAFCRRASLDLVGDLPAPERLRAFVADRDPRKRARLVGELLASPASARAWAERLCERLLGGLAPEGPTRYAREAFAGWLARALAEDRSWDALAARLVAGEGDPGRRPELYYLVDHGAQGPAPLAGAVARHFLGLRLDCARCHDHPFSEERPQAQFHGLAAFFARLRLRPTGIPGRVRVVEAPVGEHRFAPPGEPAHPVAPAA
ncbi:MAG: DUF1549 domain-containing protein, partial [Planctomycetota bacterium]